MLAKLPSMNLVKPVLEYYSKYIQKYESHSFSPNYSFIGHLGTAKLLIVRGADLNNQASFGWSTLHSCAWFGNFEFINRLS